MARRVRRPGPCLRAFMKTANLNKSILFIINQLNNLNKCPYNSPTASHAFMKYIFTLKTKRLTNF